MFGGATICLSADGDTRFLPGMQIRPFSYPPKTPADPLR
jgi:hypothetical protein